MHTLRTTVQMIIVLEQWVVRHGVCVLLWYSFCGPRKSIYINGLTVFSCNTHPTMPHSLKVTCHGTFIQL